VFTFTPEAFVEIWTPIVLGMIALSIHIKSLKIQWIAENWTRVFVFWLILTFFGTFGYAGNLGIVAGFFILCGLSVPNHGRYKFGAHIS